MFMEPFLSSGFTFNKNEYELKTKYILFNTMLSFIAIALSSVGGFRMLAGYTVQGTIDFAVALTAVIALLWLRARQRGDLRAPAYVAMAAFSFAILYSYYNGGGGIKLNAWFTALVVPIFFILGFRISMIMATVFIGTIAFLDGYFHFHDSTITLFGYVPIFLSVIFLRVYEGRLSHFAQLLSDANSELEKKVQQKTLERTQTLQEQKERLAYQAHHDHLTGLPNRIKFKKDLHAAVERSETSHNRLATFFIDLDHFKNINDSFGHNTGDQVIMIASSRIQTCIRREDMLSRFGGDEFVILVENFESEEDLETMAKHIIDCLADPIIIDQKTMFVSCSIGISIYRKDTVIPQDLVKYADTAMYRAKERGRNGYQFYASEMTETAFERVHMETGIRCGLRNEEFVVHYQPQVDSHTGTIVGMEALVRWNHKELGLIPPGKFIPLAEETGLITAIDQKVMRLGMTQMKRWHDAGYDFGRLSLNLSVKQLQDRDFTKLVREMLSVTGCQPEWIEFEVTESHIMHNEYGAIDTLNAVRDLGISIAIDDFGTGYSSLSYLKNLPVDKLKIDRSFIIDIPDNPEDTAIVKAVIAIAESLGLSVIAEGVETQRQKDALVKYGCNLIQGYLYYKPMSAEKVETLLTNVF